MKTKKNKKEMFLFNIEKYTQSDLEISFQEFPRDVPSRAPRGDERD